MEGKTGKEGKEIRRTIRVRRVKGRAEEQRRLGMKGVFTLPSVRYRSPFPFNQLPLVNSQTHSSDCDFYN